MNEPVAYFVKDKHGWWAETDKETGIPLYTHPVNPKYDPETGEPLIDGYPLFSGLPHPVKELTDEEIWDFINALCLDMGDYWELTERNAIPMIRAILRKVQE